MTTNSQWKALLEEFMAQENPARKFKCGRTCGTNLTFRDSVTCTQTNTKTLFCCNEKGRHRLGIC